MLPIALPSLRARAEDIPQLVNYFIDDFNTEFRKRVKGVSPETMKRLAMLLADAQELTDVDFPLTGGAGPRLSESVQLPPQRIDLEQLERSLVVQALERSGWNQTRAATLLGVNRDQVRYRIEKFKLEKATHS